MTCPEFQRLLWVPPRAGGVINNPDRELSDDRLRTSGLERAFPLHLLRLSLTPSDILITGEVSLRELINDREEKILWRKTWQTAQCQEGGGGVRGGDPGWQALKHSRLFIVYKAFKLLICLFIPSCSISTLSWSGIWSLSWEYWEWGRNTSNLELGATIVLSYWK